MRRSVPVRIFCGARRLRPAMRPFFAALKRALMVIEIEHKEIAGIVREQRIDADDIAAVLPLAFQMGEQSADVQRLIGPVRAVPAGNFLPCRFGQSL